jgi:hypothetical protein
MAKTAAAKVARRQEPAAPDRRVKRKHGLHTTDADERRMLAERIVQAEDTIFVVAKKLRAIADEETVQLASILEYVFRDLGELAVDIKDGRDLPAEADVTEVE